MKTLLDVQSYFSFHWGTASPADWFARAEEMGYAYIGIADQAALCGMPAIVKLAEKSRIRPLYGASFPFAEGGGVIIYAENARGYGNLCQRITAWHEKLDANPPAIAGGVPALPAASGRDECCKRQFTGGIIAIANDVEAWRGLRRAGVETYWRIGPTLAAPPAGISATTWVFAPGPVMLEPGGFDTHRLLRAIGGATTLDRFPEADRCHVEKPPVLTARPDDWLRTPEEYASRFAPYADALMRADVLAGRLARYSPCREILTPPNATPDRRTGVWAESSMARLRRLAYEGAGIRYKKITPEITARLEKELDVIHRKCFAEYFLVVHDIVARMAGGDGRVRPGRSITCGRGSGAASLVNYCLGVTNVDVMKHDLMFERFLNEKREDPPDIDVDFAWDDRDDLLARVCDEYGREKVGRVANHNRYDWRGAFRAAARALGFSDAEITRHLRESPSVYAAEPPAGPPPSATGGACLPAIADRANKRLGLLRRAGQSEWNRAERLSRRIVDFPHCLSMHCGGVVISAGTLSRSVPVVKSRKGQLTIQWEKDGAEAMGLVKIDLLGNRSLAVIRDAVYAITRDTGIPPEKVIAGDPTMDEATQNLLRHGNTFGVFYLESPSMRLLMAKARVGDFEHAVVHSSIIRPAANSFINEYIRRLHDAQKGIRWKNDDPVLDGLFEESYGIPVYQEDVIRLAARLAGYDYAKADELRKILGKREAKKMLAEKFEEIKEAAYANGMKKETVDLFRHTLMSMTGYSFCKPHSASYAQVSFEAAYLRAHYPAYFIAAVLSNEGGYYTSQSYVSEAMRLGLDVLGPDVNRSTWHWRAEGPHAVRTGFMAVSGLSRAGAEAIEQARAERPFSGLQDFFNRLRLDADDMRRLALTGGFDSLAPDWNRPQLIWHAVKASAVPDEKPKGATLFDRAPARSAPEPVFDMLSPPDLSPYTELQRMEAEYSILGFIPGHHPLALYKEEIREEAAGLARRSRPILTTASDFGQHIGKTVTLAVWPVAAKIVETKHGDAMMFQSFEDTRSLCETVIFPEEFTQYHRLLGTLQPVWITGKVLNEFDVPTIQVLAVRPARRRPGRLAGQRAMV